MNSCNLPSVYAAIERKMISLLSAQGLSDDDITLSGIGIYRKVM